VLDDLALSESSSDEDEDAQGDNAQLDKASHAESGRYDDAGENYAEQRSSEATAGSDVLEASMDATDSATTNKKRKHRGRMPKRIKKKVRMTPVRPSYIANASQQWQLYANRLMQGEPLDLENEGLPPDLATEWIAIGPIPRGKRCMVVTFNGSRRSRTGRGAKRFSNSGRYFWLTLCLIVTNAILLARTSGRPIARQHIPVLPTHCVLDCMYVPEAAAIFVVDVLQWKGQSVAEGEAEFR